MDAKLKEQLKHLELDFGQVPDKAMRNGIHLLVNGVEAFANEIHQLEEENQKLKDEINRLKGEQGRPNIRPQKKDGDISSEQERKNNKPSKTKKSKKKRHKIKAHRKQVCKVAPADLPSDAEFKGYDSVIIQDIVIQPNNIEFKGEVYYSPSLRKRIMGPLPLGYTGEFGPGIKTVVLCFYHDSGMTEPAIHRWLETVGIFISKATLSRIITDEKSVFHQEKQSILASGLRATDYQHIDDTGARVNGKNHYTHVLCNPFYTAYFTRAKKDRLTILELLSGDNLLFKINQEALALMVELGLSEKQHRRLKPLLEDQAMSRVQIEQQLDTLFPYPQKQASNRRIILEASALVVFQQKEDLIKILICDDAPQFKKLTAHLALCWIHEGRHYKKLKPFMETHHLKVDRVLTDYGPSTGSCWFTNKSLLIRRLKGCQYNLTRYLVKKRDSTYWMIVFKKPMLRKMNCYRY